MNARNNNYHPPQGPGMIMGGGDGSYVSAEKLKQVDTPVETLVGVVNGVVTGGALSAGVSALVTAGGGQEPKELVKAITKNITHAHAWPIIGFTAIMGAMSGLVRFSRARMHNQWSDRHYDFLAQQQQAGFADRLQNESKAEQAPEKAPSR